MFAVRARDRHGREGCANAADVERPASLAASADTAPPALEALDGQDSGTRRRLGLPMLRDEGDYRRALIHAEHLARLAPDNPLWGQLTIGLRQLIDEGK